MDKKEWIKHCKWLDTFRGKIVTNNEAYKDYGGYIVNKQTKKKKKDEKKKRNS